MEALTANQREFETRLAGGRKSYTVEKLVEAVRALGLTPNGDGRAGIISSSSLNYVDDEYVCFELVEEKAHGFPRPEQPKLRIILGSYGDKQQFPEPKNGFDFGKIAEAIKKRVETSKAKKNRDEEIRIKKLKNEMVAKFLNEKFGFTPYGHPRVDVNKYGDLEVNLSLRGSEEKLTDLLQKIMPALTNAKL